MAPRRCRPRRSCRRSVMQHLWSEMNLICVLHVSLMLDVYYAAKTARAHTHTCRSPLFASDAFDDRKHATGVTLANMTLGYVLNLRAYRLWGTSSTSEHIFFFKPPSSPATTPFPPVILRLLYEYHLSPTTLNKRIFGLPGVVDVVQLHKTLFISQYYVC
jgi:hypothetical protein